MTGVPSKIFPACGKNAAMRQIMRERQRKKDTMSDGQSVIRQCVESVGEFFAPKECPAAAVAEAATPGISRTVSADEGIWSVDGRDVPLPNEQREEGSVSEESLSSSHWMLMEHGLDNFTDVASMMMGSDNSRLEGLESAFSSTSSLSDKSPLRTSDETEPNVSWNIDAAASANHHDASPGDVETDAVVLSEAIDDSDDISLSSHSLSPASDDMTSAKSAPGGSPFTTFRRNSTNIALHETKAYALRIQALEEELEHARRQAANVAPDEVEFRHTLERRNFSKTPIRRFSTPGNAAHTFANSSCPTTSSRFSRVSATTSVSHESLWERNKTLVTEIRFADQTCVELAARKAALEQELEQLKSDNNELTMANQSLQAQVNQANIVNARTQAELSTLHQRLACSTTGSPSHQPIELETELDDYRQLLRDRESDLEILRVENSRLSRQIRNADVLSGVDVQSAYDTTSSQIPQQTRQRTVSKESDGPPGQQASDGILEQVELFQSEIDEMVVRMSDERAEVVNNIGGVLHELEARSNELADAVVSKVRHLEQRLLSCGEAVKCIMGVLQDKRMAEDMALQRAESNESNTSQEGDLEATFSRDSDSADLSYMEAARSDKIRQAVPSDRAGSESSSVDRFQEGSTSSSCSDVLPDDTSTLPESPTWSPRRSAVDHFQQHLSWLASPNSISEPYDIANGVGSPKKRMTPTGNPSNNDHELIDSIVEVDYNARVSASETVNRDSRNQSSLRQTVTVELGKQSPVKMTTAQHSEAPRGHLDKERTESDDEGTNSGHLVSNNRDTLRVHFEALQRSKSQAEAMLSQKSIFPRKRESNTNANKTESIHGEGVAARPVGQDHSDSGLKWKSIIHTLEESQANYSYRVTELESSLDRIVRERDILRGDMCTLKADNDDLAKEKDRLRELERDHMDTIEHMKDTIKSLTERLLSSEVHVDDLRASLEIERTQRTDLVDSNDKLKAAVANLEHDLNVTRSLVAAAEARHLQTSDEFNARCLEACRSRDAIIDNRDELLHAVTSLTDKLQYANNVLEQTNMELTDAKAALQNLEQSKQDTAALATQYLVDLKAATVELDQSKAQVNAGKEAVKSAEALLEHQKMEAKELASILSLCQDSVLALESQLRESHEMLQKSTDEAEKLRSQKESVTTKCTRLRDYIRKLTKKCDEWEAFHESETSTMEQLKSAYEAALVQAALLASTCETRETMHDAERKKVDSLELANKRLESELSVIVRELSTLTNAQNY